MLLLRIRKSLDNVVSGNDTPLSGLAQVRNALPVVTQEDMRQPAIEIRFGEVGIQFDCLIVISQRRTIVFQHGRYIAAVIIAVNEVRSQPDDVIQIITIS